jgi:hypothetical protein
MVLLGLGAALSGSALAQQPLGDLYAGDASVHGAVVLGPQATQVLSGSQIAAGDGSALLKLARGGQVRICPKTNLSLSSGADGKTLSMGLDAGAVELQYGLETGSDALITPDFRLQMISPGSFHFAISVGPTGDTCLRTLPGDTAAVFVSEMMGNGIFQLSPGKNILLHAGKVADAAEAPSVCGCPQSAPPESKPAESKPPESATASPEPKSLAPAVAPSVDSKPVEVGPAEAALAGAPETPVGQPAEPAKAPESSEPEKAHLEADTRFAYRGDEADEDVYTAVARLSLATNHSGLALGLVPQATGPQAQAPPLAPAKSKGNIFRRFGSALRRFFSSGQ